MPHSAAFDCNAAAGSSLGIDFTAAASPSHRPCAGHSSARVVVALLRVWDEHAIEAYPTQGLALQRQGAPLPEWLTTVGLQVAPRAAVVEPASTLPSIDPLRQYRAFDVTALKVGRRVHARPPPGSLRLVLNAANALAVDDTRSTRVVLKGSAAAVRLARVCAFLDRHRPCTPTDNVVPTATESVGNLAPAGQACACRFTGCRSQHEDHPVAGCARALWRRLRAAAEKRWFYPLIMNGRMLMINWANTCLATS